jgi:hypothetical protein
MKAAKAVFLLADDGGKTEGSLIHVRSGGTLMFDRIAADGKDYIVVHAGGQVTLSAPVKRRPIPALPASSR